MGESQLHRVNVKSGATRNLAGVEFGTCEAREQSQGAARRRIPPEQVNLHRGHVTTIVVRIQHLLKAAPYDVGGKRLRKRGPID
jgi:hypothetical protein